MIKHLILLKIQNMMDIKVLLRQWFITAFLKKKLQVESPRLQINLQLKMRICLIKIS